MRRLALILVGAGLLLTGCNHEGTVQPLPSKVVGKLPGAPKLGKGNATAGNKIFNAQGCGNCHAYAAAHSKGTVGPDLDQKLKGKTPQFIQESIINPNAFVEPGYPPNVMPQTYSSTLSSKQIDDLVAFLTPATKK